jgi:hypothetical protein
MRSCLKMWREKECVESFTQYHSVILYNMNCSVFVLLSKNTLKSTHLKQIFSKLWNKNYITMIWEVQIWLFWGHLFFNSSWVTCVSYIQNCANTKECHHVCLRLPTMLKTTITCKPCDANLFHLHCTTSLGLLVGL